MWSFPLSVRKGNSTHTHRCKCAQMQTLVSYLSLTARAALFYTEFSFLHANGNGFKILWWSMDKYIWHSYLFGTISWKKVNFEQTPCMFLTSPLVLFLFSSFQEGVPESRPIIHLSSRIFWDWYKAE